MKILYRDKIPAAVLPDAVHLAHCAIDSCSGELFDVEQAAVSRAVDKRKREFTAGRILSRDLLQRMGFSATAIPSGSMREPLWPSGVVGSISHHDNECMSAISRQDSIALLGIDVTGTEALQEELRPMICTNQEIELARNISATASIDPYKIIFSLKESVFKSLFPIVQNYFGFDAVSVVLHIESGRAEISLNSPELTARIRSDAALQARFCSFDDYIFTCVWALPDRVELLS